MSGFRVVIPARYASMRLPGKPLLEIAGRPLIEHVYRRAVQASASAVVIATDDAAIHAVAERLGAQAVMTSPDHQSGSDRIAECADRLGWDDETLVVNLQGDEPLMPSACLEQVAALLTADPDADVSSLYWPVASADEASDPNSVKVVVDRSGAALYFSRAAIPYPRAAAQTVWKRHIGLYAYRAGALRAFAATAPGELEQSEKLEQLRFLEAGRKIRMARACEAIPAGVDTLADLQRVRDLLAAAD
ncbi:MAG: 3-deoxy-manno-octulosonate cytidylyltransferase [Xanthomonadales bacterium]|nr:3-deoxy-manno-octulosonate cytidylyltransferase [Xanthomonadales bacterium]